MLIGQFAFFKLGFELGVEDFLKDVFESSVVGLENCVLGAQKDRIVALQTVVKRRSGKTTNRFVKVIHTHHDTSRFEVCDFHFDWLTAILRHIRHRHSSGTRHFEVSRLVLITVSVSPNHNRLAPVRHKFRNVLADNWLAKHDAIQNVANSSVWRLPHLLQIELFDSRLIWRNCRALHAHAMLQNCIRCINRDLVTRRVSVLDAQVVVVDVYI